MPVRFESVEKLALSSHGLRCKMILHTQNEEEVSYPIAILIGEYLKRKLVLRTSV